MVKKTRSERGQRGNILVFLTLALPFFVGLVGLGIDATMCYIVQTELSAAVDGAALGTGRLLSTTATATDIANEFLNANFRVGQYGFWGSYNLTPTVTVTNGITKTVVVTATATVPLLFMRLLGQNLATVGATATVTRRDARVEFVIDRSGSMTTIGSDGSEVITEAIQKAQSFTEQFTSCASSSCTTPLDYDELGMVAFSGSAVVGYPTTPWPASLSASGTGGPDIYFYNGATTDMVHQLGNIKAASGTAMGDALALAYLELQKTHVADMAANGGVDTRMNAIVLFTDGVPSSVVTYLNKNSGTVISAGSGCKYQKDTATPTNPMYGYIVQASGSGNPPYTSAWGLYQIASIDPNTSSHTSAWYMANPTGDYVAPSPNTPETSCGGWDPLNNLSAMPSIDKYGYSLAMNTNPSGTGNGYKLSSFVGNPSGATSLYTGTSFSTASGTSAYQWGLASWDEVDNVAEAIRSDSNYASRGETSPMPITIYTIGYTGNGGTDVGLLQKIANVASCKVNGFSCVNSTQQQGIYAQASDAASISNAFNVILTAILRLAH